MVPDPSLVDTTTLEAPPDTAELTAAISRLRGLGVHQAIAVERLDETAFRRRLESTHGTRNPLGPAYGLLGAGDARSLDRTRSALAKLVGGFYDTREKNITLRDEERTGAERVLVLAHEVDHALQDQNGLLDLAHRKAGISNDEDGEESDAALAVRALIEGDATVTSVLYVARVRLGLSHLFRRVIAGFHEKSIEALPVDKDDDASARFYRRHVDALYVGGSMFVADLYRAGGFPLVDRVFDGPPVSTEQVLHPEKYLSGELPITVPVPAAPEGTSRIGGGTMGELRTRAFLAACPGSQAGPPLGWGGDALATVAEGSGRRGVLWSTVWDDPISAQRFEERLRSADTCLQKVTDPSHAADARGTIVRNDDRVVYVQGLEPERREEIARTLLAVPVERQPASPAHLGEVSLDAWMDPDSFLQRGQVRDGAYVSDLLGLTVPTTTFDVKPGGEVTLERYVGDSRVSVRLWVLLDAWTPSIEERLASNLVKAHRDAGQPVEFQGLQAVPTPIGVGRVLTWAVGREGNRRLVTLPVCHGQMTVVAMSIDGGTIGWDVERNLLRRIRIRDDSPACRLVSQTTSNG